MRKVVTVLAFLLVQGWVIYAWMHGTPPPSSPARPPLVVPRELVVCVSDRFRTHPDHIGYQLSLWSVDLLAGRGFQVECGAQTYTVRIE